MRVLIRLICRALSPSLSQSLQFCGEPALPVVRAAGFPAGRAGLVVSPAPISLPFNALQEGAQVGQGGASLRLIGRGRRGLDGRETPGGKGLMNHLPFFVFPGEGQMIATIDNKLQLPARLFELHGANTIRQQRFHSTRKARQVPCLDVRPWPQMNRDAHLQLFDNQEVHTCGL